MRILICDGNEQIANEMTKQILDICDENKENIIITTFKNMFEIYDYIETKRVVVDAIFIDICKSENNKKSLLSIAQKIKEAYPYINIVFYVEALDCKDIEEMLELNPLYVLLKPMTVDKLKKVIGKITDIGGRKQYLNIKKVGSLLRLDVNDIYFVESKGKYVYIHTKDGMIATINKIEKIMEQLGIGFVRCHQSYIVNCDKVKEYDYTDIMLCDGTHISVSRSYKNRIKEMFSDQDL